MNNNILTMLVGPLLAKGWTIDQIFDGDDWCLSDSGGTGQKAYGAYGHDIATGFRLRFDITSKDPIHLHMARALFMRDGKTLVCYWEWDSKTQTGKTAVKDSQVNGVKGIRNWINNILARQPKRR